MTARQCVRCAELAATRTSVVFGAGNADAELMFVGEAPGANEDLQGLPFVGAAGKLLEQLLGENGLSRAEVFIANVLKCRPPGNRDPQPGEIENCRPYLVRQIELIEPRVICTLGNFATKLLRGKPDGITRIHGEPEVLHDRRAHGAALPALSPGGGACTPSDDGDGSRRLRQGCPPFSRWAAPPGRVEPPARRRGSPSRRGVRAGGRRRHRRAAGAVLSPAPRVFESDGPEATEAVGAALAEELRDGATSSSVTGELGAGKTTLVRGAARALGVPVAVTSPQFAIGHRYEAGEPTRHARRSLPPHEPRERGSRPPGRVHRPRADLVHRMGRASRARTGRATTPRRSEPRRCGSPDDRGAPVKVLGFDTATPVTAVGLSCDGSVTQSRDSVAPGGRGHHAEHLLIQARELLAAAGLGWNELTSSPSGSGPGGYTGLRIGLRDRPRPGLCELRAARRRRHATRSRGADRRPTCDIRPRRPALRAVHWRLPG